MLHHIPTHGHGLLVYGPHVGVDWDGCLGKVNRRGHEGSGACCAAANAAAELAQMVQSGERQECDIPNDILDAQQTWVEKELLKHAERLQKAEDPAVELPHALLDCHHELIDKLVQKTASQLNEGQLLALVGGIQINTPEGTGTYMLVLSVRLQDTVVGVLISLFAVVLLLFQASTFCPNDSISWTTPGPSRKTCWKSCTIPPP